MEGWREKCRHKSNIDLIYYNITSYFTNPNFLALPSKLPAFRYDETNNLCH